MDYPFRLPDGRTIVVPSWGNLPVELLEAIAGVKPATHAWVDVADEPRLVELCEAFGLRHLVFTRPSENEGQSSGLSHRVGATAAARLEVMIGKDPAVLAEAARVWHTPNQNPGVHLGYPECCVESYMAWHRRYPSVDDPDYVDVLRHTHSLTERPERLPFYVNNVFYIYSRRWGQDGPAKREELMRRNQGLDLDLLNLMSWHPCTYRCPESLRKAKATWAVMRAMVPSLAALVKTCLARPVLLWDWTRFVVLKGKPEGENAFVYDGIQPPFSLVEPERLARVRAADRVALLPGGALELRTKGKTEIWTDDPPLLFGFSE